MPKAKKLTVLLADDHKMFRQGVKQFILELDLVDKVVEAANGKEVIDILKQGQSVDIIILDLHMPVMSGSEVCRYVKAQKLEVKIIILSMLVNGQNTNQLLDLGAHYCLPKDVGVEELEEAIIHLAQGKKQEPSGGKLKDEHRNITEKEINVLKLIAQGFCSKQIAAILNIGIRAVDTRREAIYKKLGAKNSSEAVQKARLQLII